MVENSIIADNVARGGLPGDTDIGWSDYGRPYGGGIYCGPANNPTIRNCTITRNELYTYKTENYYGSGICSDGGTTTVPSSIIWGNYGYDIYGSGFNISYSNIQGGYDGTGNIDSDPAFVEPDNGDFHLGACSRCIDRGDNSAPGLPEHDFEGDDRIVDGDGDGTATVDMGVDEVAVAGTCFRSYLALVLRNAP